jgi:pimeloyl-ACP methyl ester carboxylesterase
LGLVSRIAQKAATISAMKQDTARTDRSHSLPERGVSILNGMIGDYLQQRGNELAIGMSFRHEGRPLALKEASLRSVYPALTPKLCVLVHGFCCNESVWTFPAAARGRDHESYGTRLQRGSGYTPFYVRYNTGLPVAESAAELAALMARLVAAYPPPVEEITLIGHSMGGLVIRGACDPARPESASWLAKVRRAIYIGTPHDGADLERFAHGATGALKAFPGHVTQLIGDLLSLRSRGTRDLGAGHVPSAGGAAPWLPTARHYLLMGTLTRDPKHPVGRIFGDALVRVPRAKDAAGADSPEPEVIVFPGVHHLALAHDDAVYRCIRQICAGA